MAKTIKNIDYDYENDILKISKEGKIKASLDIGDFVLDVNFEGFISGIEILDASENLGISKEYLKEIKKASMAVTYKPGYVYVLLLLFFVKEDKEVRVPIPLTVDLGQKQTVRKEMVFA